MTGTHGPEYEEGVRDGRLKSLERRADATDATDASHERRLQYLEKIVYGLAAVAAFTSVLPQLWEFIDAAAQ
jgi:hypothetical protein